jgi:hypothetical protein
LRREKRRTDDCDYSAASRFLIAMQVTRQHVVEVLRASGLPEVADEANRSLPEELDLERAADFLAPYGITKDALISRMGGSP